MNEAKPLGLYLHIPFCKSKCIYCDFYSLPRAEEEMDRYVAALKKHLTDTAPAAALHRIDTVYFGGGTPSYLGEKRLCELLETLFRHYSVAADAEITLEANPDSLGARNTVHALVQAGINRISLGVQSADDRQLRQLGRIHTFSEVVQAVEAARAGGIENLSLDLIYGLPGQDADSWRDTLEKVVALAPEHLSCYGLKVEEGTPLWTLQNTLSLPDDDLQADMYLQAAELLTQRGYEHYEISNFAKPGRASRHNMKYWTLGEYAGFGPGAHSDFGGIRYAYVRDLDRYCRGVEGQGDLFSEREAISPEERAMEFLMLGLRTARGVSAAAFEARFQRSFAPIAAVLERFCASGHAARRDGQFVLTTQGFLVSNQIISLVLDAMA